MSAPPHALSFARNPMIRKELRQRLRERRGWILPSLYLVVVAAVATFAYYEMTASEGGHIQGAEIGVMMFLVAAYTQLSLLLLLSPIFSAGALTIEKEQRTLPALLVTLLGGYRIWWGKLVASLLFVFLLLVAALPILSTAFAFGGISLWPVFSATMTTVIILLTINAISLYWSSAFRRSVVATAVSYVTVVILTIVTFIIFLATMSASKATTWTHLSFLKKLPLYCNPVFFLTLSFSPVKMLYPDWFISLGIFAGLGAIATALTLWNLSRSGESG